MIGELTLFDGIVIAFVCVSVVLGLMRGLVRELSTLGAFVASLAVALLAQPWLVARLQPVMPPDTPAWLPDVIVFTLVFLVVNIVIVWLGGKLSGIIQRISGIGFLDSLGGGLFGLTRSAVVLIFCVWLTDLVIDRKDIPDSIRNSVSYPVMEASAKTLTRHIPELAMRERLRRGRETGDGP